MSCALVAGRRVLSKAELQQKLSFEGQCQKRFALAIWDEASARPGFSLDQLRASFAVVDDSLFDDTVSRLCSAGAMKPMFESPPEPPVGLLSVSEPTAPPMHNNLGQEVDLIRICQ